jgi:hypothetical protein
MRLIADAGAPPGRYDRVHGNHARRHGEKAAHSAPAATVPNLAADDTSSSERSAGADARERSARAAADAPREEDITRARY